MRGYLTAGLTALATLSSVAPPAVAGQTRYDAATKSFALTYTYASVPSTEQIMADPTSMDQVGASEEGQASSEVDDQVRSFLGEVNQILGRATRGLATISRLDHVPGTKDADVIITLNVRSGRGGVAAPLAGANVGVPGHFNLYYQTLVSERRSEIALTAAHELCHYFFGVPDEYLDRFNGPRCPQANGPGCLMDNYLVRGWIGRMCSPAEHQGLSPPPRYFDGAQGSCQDILAKFFRDRQGLDFFSQSESSGLVATTTPTTTVDRAVIAQAANHPDVQSALTGMRRGGGPLTPEGRAALRRKAQAVLLALLGGKKPTAGDLFQAGIQVVELLEGPSRIVPLLTLLRDEAKRLAGAVDKSGTQAEVVNRINSNLLGFLRTQLAPGGAPEAVALGPDEVQFVGQIAAEAVGGGAVPGPGGLIPGRRPDPNRERRTILFAPMPIRSEYPGFPADLVKTQGNALASYQELSTEALRFFVRLLRKDSGKRRISIQMPEFAAPGVANEPAAVGLKTFEEGQVQQAGEASFKAGGAGAVRDAVNLAKGDLTKTEVKDALNLQAPTEKQAVNRRTTQLETVLDRITAEIAADRVENIILLVPPGGLPDDLRQRLEPLAAQVLGKTDVRLDVALVGTVTIPRRLRDLAVRSGGTILTIADLDEAGAVFQRLSNAETQGTWIAIPDQGRITIKTAGDPDAAPPVTTSPTPYRALYERLVAIRDRVPHNRVALDQNPIRVALMPFYVDGTSEVELIVGLSQALAIDGLSGRADGAPPGTFPPPTLDFKLGLQGPPARLSIEQHDDGFDALNPNLELDVDTSTSNFLVYRLPAQMDGGLGPGWYTPVLTLDPANFRDRDGANKPKDYAYHENAIDYTFSVGKPRSKTKVFASLVQTDLADPTKAYRGTISDQRVAIIQAEVNAGLPVRGAAVRGYVQRLVDGDAGQVRTTQIEFRDDGTAPDLRANDGIYSTTIGLGAQRLRGAEYRVFIEAETTTGSRFIAPEALSAADTKSNADNQATIPMLQRATSIQFRVAADQSD